MAIDNFTRMDFESALPTDKTTKQPLWRTLGVLQSEYAYYLPVNGYCGIMVRSSVKPDGKSAATGQDSIRIWLCEPLSYSPIGSTKLQRWVTRVRGWQTRLSDNLRAVYKLGLHVRPCECGKGQITPFLCHNTGPHHGHPFVKCVYPGAGVKGCGYFQWLEDK